MTVAGGEVFCFGHSVGGTLALAAEMRRPGTFAAMFLYEPVILTGRALNSTSRMTSPYDGLVQALS